MKKAIAAAFVVLAATVVLQWIGSLPRRLYRLVRRREPLPAEGD